MFKLLLRLTLLKTLSLAVLFIPLAQTAELDLNTWGTLLKEAVTDGDVDYTLWQNNPKFNLLVEQIANVDSSQMDRREKLVFYINAYNILAARGILDGSSPRSLLSRYVYFKRDSYLVAGDRITLHELEHKIIRPMQEPRIHFAIVCASRSCPILQSEAYTSQDLDQQLTMAASGFINDPERNQFNALDRRADLSSLFQWFEDDFVAAAGSLQAYLAPMVDNAEVADLLKRDAFEIHFRKYDWRLNGTL